jgi:hypothetical protein
MAPKDAAIASGRVTSHRSYPPFSTVSKYVNINRLFVSIIHGIGGSISHCWCQVRGRAMMYSREGRECGVQDAVTTEVLRN